jgi:predicted DCC family thiol-disulfide oxidoreductase YuxK
VLLYDDACRFCRWSLATVLRRDRDHRLEPVALQEPRAAGLLAGMPESVRMGSWHLVADDGAISSAGAAVPRLLALLRAHRAARRLAERHSAVVEGGYALIARNRGSLGRLVTEGALARADAVIAQAAPPRLSRAS